jgi:hypothetical protein
MCTWVSPTGRYTVLACACSNQGLPCKIVRWFCPLSTVSLMGRAGGVGRSNWIALSKYFYCSALSTSCWIFQSLLIVCTQPCVSEPHWLFFHSVDTFNWVPTSCRLCAGLGGYRDEQKKGLRKGARVISSYTSWPPKKLFDMKKFIGL